MSFQQCRTISRPAPQSCSTPAPCYQELTPVNPTAPGWNNPGYVQDGQDQAQVEGRNPPSFGNIAGFSVLENSDCMPMSSSLIEDTLLALTVQKSQLPHDDIA